MKTEHTSTSSLRPFIKVCGLTYTGTVDCAVAYGAAYIGFHLYPDSPLYISPARAARLQSAHVKRVGVFSGQSAAEICRSMQVAGLHYAQLRGNAAPGIACRIGRQRVIRSLRVEQGAGVAALQAELDAWAPFCAAFHIEAEDAALLQQLRMPRPWILSPRVPRAALPELLRRCRPDGVDIESHVECTRTMAAMRAVS